MIGFWLVILLMTALAIILVLIPLLRIKLNSHPSSESVHVDLYRQNLQQLQAEWHAGTITAEEYQISLDELDQALLNDVPVVADRSIATRRDFKIIFILLLTLPVLALVLYWYWGASYSVQANKQAQLARAAMKEYGSVSDVITKLEAKLADNPNSAKAWYLLGKLYLSQHEFIKAQQAFAKADTLQPNDTEIMLQYAESEYFANQQHLNAHAKQLLNTILKHDSKNLNAINLLAVAAYQQGNYQQAIILWEKILASMPVGTDEQETVLQMIAKAQQQLTSSNSSSDLAIEVQVKLDPKLQSKITTGDSLYVFAQAVNGPPIPLAVERQTVTAFPVTFKLDQSNAMLPSMTLKDFKQIRIVARISKSGQALPKAGDLQGVSEVINLQKTHKIMVTIAEQIP